LNIGSFEAVKVGIGRSVKNWRLVILVYIINIFFAAVLAIPIASMFARDVSNSLAGSNLLDGFNSTAVRWYVEFINANKTFFSSLLPQIAMIFLLYIALEVFLAGGFYSVFSTKERLKLRDFISKGSSYFFPLLVVTIMEVALLGLVYLGNSLWVSADKDAAGIALADYMVLRAELWRYGIVLFVSVIVFLLADFIRAAVVIDNDDFWSKVKRGLSFAGRHPLATSGVYLSGISISAAVIALFFLFRFWSENRTGIEVAIEIVVSQLIILFRIL